MVPEKCSSCKHEDALPEHTCPFQEEIRDDYTTKCDCCEACQANCRDEI